MKLDKPVVEYQSDLDMQQGSTLLDDLIILNLIDRWELEAQKIATRQGKTCREVSRQKSRVYWKYLDYLNI